MDSNVERKASRGSQPDTVVDVEKGMKDSNMSSQRTSDVNLSEKSQGNPPMTATAPTTQDPNDPGPPPDGGYGWVVTVCQFLITAAGWGISTSFGVFLSYYRKVDYFPGATDLQFAFIGGISVAFVLWIAPLANYLSNRFGFKTSMFLGAALYFASQMLAAFSVKIWQLFLTQGLLFGCGLGLFFVPTLPLLSTWFTTKRALATGLMAGGSGGGSLVFSFTTHAAIANLGLRWAFIINAIVTAVILVPCIALMKAHRKIQFATLEWRFWIHPGFIWVLLWGFFSVLGYIIAIYTLATFSTSGLNFTQSQGATLTAILALGQMVGRPATGMLLDRFGRITLASFCSFIAGLTCLFIWMFGRSYGVLIFFALVQGIFGGSFWASCGPVSAEVAGVTKIGSALAILWVTVAPAALVAEPIALSLIDYSTNTLHRERADAYLICIGIAGGSFVLAAFLLLGAKRWVQGNWNMMQKS